MQKIVEMIQKNKNLLLVKKKIIQAKNASINYALPRKYTKNFDQKFKMQSIDFYASNAIKITVITLSVNFVNKSIQTLDGLRMMINGLDVINVTDG